MVLRPGTKRFTLVENFNENLKGLVVAGEEALQLGSSWLRFPRRWFIQTPVDPHKRFPRNEP